MPEGLSCPGGFSHEVPSRGLPWPLRVRTLPHPHSEPRRIAVFAVRLTPRSVGEAWTAQGKAIHTTLTSGPPPGGQRTRRHTTVTKSPSRPSGGEVNARGRGTNSGPVCSMGSSIAIPTTTTTRPRERRRGGRSRLVELGRGVRRTIWHGPRNGRELARIIATCLEVE